MKEIYYFGTRPPPAQTPSDSPFREFMVQCLKCHSWKLRVICEQDSESEEMAAYLFCPRCRARERLPMR